MKKLKSVFKATPEGGSETEYAVLRPGPKVISEGQKVYNRKFRELADAGTYVRPALDKMMAKQGIWDDEMEAQAKKLSDGLTAKEKKLASKSMKLTQGKDLALEMAKDRRELSKLNGERFRLIGLTAEAQAENERFNYVVSACMVLNDSGKPVFSGLDDYIEHASEPHARAGAAELAKMMGADEDFYVKLPEVRFLIDYGFADAKGRLIDAKGRLISEDGKLIDEEGYYLNEAGKRVDKDGVLVDDDGNYVPEDAGEFLDDTGKPVRKKGQAEPDEEKDDAPERTSFSKPIPTPEVEIAEKAPAGKHSEKPVNVPLSV